MDRTPSILDFLINSPLARHLEPEDLRILARATKLRKLNTGETLYEEDSPANSLSCLVDGRLEVLKAGADGEPRRLAYVSPGCLVGEVEALDGLPRVASVRAVKPSRLLYLDRESLRSLIETSPRIGPAILKAMVRSLSDHLIQADAVMSEMYGPVTPRHAKVVVERQGE